MTIINVCNLFAPIVGPLIGIINILILDQNCSLPGKTKKLFFVLGLLN